MKVKVSAVSSFTALFISTFWGKESSGTISTRKSN